MQNPLISIPALAQSADSVPLRATHSGTARFRERFHGDFAADYFRETTFGPIASSIGVGTYLGESSDADDAAYETAIRHAIESGVNVIDTAINYRGQRSECSVGAALQQLFAGGKATRQELIVCSKGGYIPLDRAAPASRTAYQAYVQREFIDSEILRPEDIVAGGHSLAPRFLRYCLAKSRQNLGLRAIDIYYVHNPGQQLGSVTAEELLQRMRSAFTVLEEAASRGDIGVYGVATWDELRTPPGSPNHVSLEALVAIAQELAGDRHHFRAVQVPTNLGMLEAIRTPTQSIRGELSTLSDAAAEFGLTLVASATLLQGKLATGLPQLLHDHFPACTTDAQRAIAFARSLPGITTSLVGMKRSAHVDENLAAARS
jgi:aryl-alcohol dehydrogenase-like predicted oxidoreductase